MNLLWRFVFRPAIFLVMGVAATIAAAWICLLRIDVFASPVATGTALAPAATALAPVAAPQTATRMPRRRLRMPRTRRRRTLKRLTSRMAVIPRGP